MSDVLFELERKKKVYFASDFHLGIPDAKGSIERERLIVRWLTQVSEDAQAICLLGDIFDFWFEYKEVVPKGSLRLLGKLAELSDRGIKIILFAGNHDLWINDYFVNEIGALVYHDPLSLRIGNHEFHIAHGDGLGPGDRKYKFYKRIFTNPVCRWAFRWLHPDVGVALAKRWSRGSRLSQEKEALTFFGDQEWLIMYSREVEQKKHHDYYIYGHRHISGTYALGHESMYVNLGEWVNGSSYAVYDGKQLILDKLPLNEN